MTDRTIGIDLGSRTTKIVALEGDRVAFAEVFDTGHDPLSLVSARLAGLGDCPTVATGYGRHLLRERFGHRAITEISACARGVAHLAPDARLVIDIGGQDSKVILVTPGGGFDDFVMNDRCAAGTGRFLEVMAGALGYSIEELGPAALLADAPAKVNSMCTVFAESEVVSLITSGQDRHRIALGLHHSVVERVAAMVPPGAGGGPAIFVGGVALNPCVVKLLQRRLRTAVVVPDEPQIVSALGAALIAQSLSEGTP
ncbi:MAG: acyl-CoA dehydratase activase [Armatimonadota bacterium]